MEQTGNNNSEWSKGINHEVEFWKGFIKTGQFATWIENKPTPELTPYTVQFFKEKLTPKMKVLDIGSGVVSILNGLVPNEQLVACDPLADEYAKIFDYSKHDVVKPFAVSGEDVVQLKTYFDIIFMRNALDHSKDPLKVLSAMAKACKSGGHTVIQGFENEAEHENWQGFHQWNIKLIGNRMRIDGKNGTIDMYGGNYYTNVEKLPNGKTWFTWITKM